MFDVQSRSEDFLHWGALANLAQELCAAETFEQISVAVKSAARELSGADGITIVLRDGSQCHYVDEDAISPLWKGQRFPMSACISGWCMLNGATAVIPDIYADPRIPADAYRPTFVKSLVMTPVGGEQPVAAIGAYWAKLLTPDDRTVAVLETIARLTATALVSVKRLETLRQQKATRERTESLHAAQKRALELVVQNAPLSEVLETLLQTLDAESITGMCCSILLLANDGAHLRHGAAPGLPASYNAAIDGIAIGPNVGSCGTAAYKKQPVYVSDIATDPLWSDFRDLALAHNLRACWSVPIMSAAGVVLGTFAMYYDNPREPGPDDLDLVDAAARTAALIIERKRSEETLDESREQLRSELADSRLLQSLSFEMARERNIEALYQKIVVAAGAIMRSQFATMQAYHPERGTKGELKLLASTGFAPEVIKFWEWVRVDSGCTCGHVLRTGRRAIAGDVETCDYMAGTPDRDALLAGGIRAAQSTPLISRSGELVGMISTHWNHPHEPSERDLRLLDILARQAADLIERQKWEQELLDSEERFRAFTEATFDVVYRVSADWTEMRQLHGREFIADTLEPSRTWLEKYIHPDDRQVVVNAFQHAIKSKSIFELEHRVIQVDGTLGWTHSRAIPILSEDGEITEWFGAARDVTERKRSEDALRESEARFRHMADHAPVMVWVTDTVGSCIFLSQSWYEFTGQTPETGLGFGWLDATHPDDRASAEKGFLAANARNEPFRLEYRLRRHDGAYRWAMDTAAPRFGGAGEFLGYIGSVIDITERKVAEESLRRNHETFYNLVKRSPLGVYLIDSQFCIAQVSDGAMPAFRNVRPLIGHDFADALRIIWPEPFASEVIERFRHTLATGEPYLAPSLIHERRDIGRVESYEWQIHRIVLPDGQYGVVCYYYDSTRLQEAQASLRESEERFRMLADNMDQLAWTCDKLGEVTWYNQRWLDYTGLSYDEMKDWGWKQVQHPEHVERVVASVTRCRENGEEWEDVFPLRGKDGEYRWFLSRAVPIRDAGGEIVRWFGTNTDITDQRRAEETQQMLTSELSHRVKNMLATVQAIATQTLRHNSDPDQFVASFSGRIQSMSRVHSMLSSSDWQGAELHELIRDQLTHGPANEARVEAQGPTVYLEAQSTPHLAMMLHELGTNSIKYGALSNSEGIVAITWTVEQETLNLEWRERGGPPVTASLKRGFGSSLIERSASSAGGSAHLDMHVDGVVWKIRLPLSANSVKKRETPPFPVRSGNGARAHSKDQESDAAPQMLAGKRFLIIEDEPLVALEIAASLEQSGAEIAGSTGHVSEALKLIKDTTVHAALLDANLHGQPVDDIAAALDLKDVPFVFITGYGRDNLPSGFTNTPVLSKPFNEPQLLRAASRLLQES